MYQVFTYGQHKHVPAWQVDQQLIFKSYVIEKPEQRKCQRQIPQAYCYIGR